MATRKKAIPEDCMPKCETCNAGRFVKGENAGECHLLPMDWIYAGDGDRVARWKPCVREGWCRHYERELNA